MIYTGPKFLPVPSALMTVTLGRGHRLRILKMFEFSFKLIKTLFSNLITDLIHLWFDENFAQCNPPTLPRPRPPPQSPHHTHTHPHTPRSCQNQGHGLRILQKQNVQYQASYHVWQLVLLLFWLTDIGPWVLFGFVQPQRLSAINLHFSRNQCNQNKWHSTYPNDCTLALPKTLAWFQSQIIMHNIRWRLMLQKWFADICSVFACARAVCRTQQCLFFSEPGLCLIPVRQCQIHASN